MIDDLATEGLTPLPEERRAQWRADTAARFGLDARNGGGPGRAPLALPALPRTLHALSIRRGADREIRESYGDRRYVSLGRAIVEARVTDAAEAMFLPAVYRVGDVRWLEGEPGRLEEVVAFEGLYCNAAERGERILVTGHLEAERSGGRRLVVGSGFLQDGGALRVVR